MRLVKKKPIQMDRLFHAPGDGTRRAIVDRLSRGPVSVSELATNWALRSQPLASILRFLRKVA